MTKRSGFAVKITAFIEADANDGESMATALRIIKEQYSVFTEARFIGPKLSTRFMLSREVPDAPVASGPSPTVTNGELVVSTSYDAANLPEGTTVTPTMPRMPEIPAAQRRS